MLLGHADLQRASPSSNMFFKFGIVWGPTLNLCDVFEGYSRFKGQMCDDARLCLGLEHKVLVRNIVRFMIDGWG